MVTIPVYMFHNHDFFSCLNYTGIIFGVGVYTDSLLVVVADESH